MALADVAASSARHPVHHGTFGTDFFARFFGTPRFVSGQTVLVVLWIAVNAAAFGSAGIRTRSSS